ncbi:MAG: membrane protein insertion efficiency factor YidD [bacterium]|nr:membrane protein insertion efficiency factor YidD [bacterium]
MVVANFRIVILIVLFAIFDGSISSADSFDLQADRQPWGIKNEKAVPPKTPEEKKLPSFLSGLKSLSLKAIRIYQLIISPQQGKVCNFEPSCSHFGFEAIHRYGPIKGILITSDRLQRCHYWVFGEYYLSPEGRLCDPAQNHCLWENLHNLECGYYEKDILPDIPPF